MPTEAEGSMQRLNTELLEGKYGPVSVRLLSHDNEIRESHLVDRHGISRTYAVTFLAPSYPEELAPIDAEIRNGVPIGRTFRKYGYDVRKNYLKALTVELPLRLRSEFAHPSRFAKAFISEFLARIDVRPPVLYGTVIEIFSPDFRSPAMSERDLLQGRATMKSLIVVGVPPEEIWERLGNGTAGERADPRYLEARRNCEREILLIEERLALLLRCMTIQGTTLI